MYFYKIFNLYLTDINNKTIIFRRNIFLTEKKGFEKMIFSRFESDPELDPDPLFHKTDPRIRIQIKMKRIRNTNNRRRRHL